MSVNLEHLFHIGEPGIGDDFHPAWWDPIGDKIADVLRGLDPGPDDASVFQDYIEHHLQTAMCTVYREVRCPRGPTKNGRIDLIAECNGAMIALELDWTKPRFKSLAKLRNFRGYRIVVLRRSDPWPYPLQGIDAVVCVPVVEPLQPFLAGQSQRA